jgi:fructose-bisphosphate aldolase class II
MLTTNADILNKAHLGGYAVGAFNINNMEIAQSVAAAAEAERSPVILSVSEGAIKYAGIDYIAGLARLAASKTDVPVSLHLDHGGSFEICARCIQAGFTSVMIDASHEPLEENIRKTAEVVRMAHACGVSVEAELGRLSGIEDNISVSAADAFYTDPAEAVTFVRETGIDALAIAIGTAHGKYKGIPKLDYERLSLIKGQINIPIVLHGASGLTQEQLQETVRRGVNKINIDTDVRLAFTQAVRDVLTTKPEEYDPRKICGPARDAMTQVVREKIRLFGSAGKAD